MFGEEIAGARFDADTANVEAVGIPAQARVGSRLGGFWFGVGVAAQAL